MKKRKIIIAMCIAVLIVISIFQNIVMASTTEELFDKSKNDLDNVSKGATDLESDSGIIGGINIIIGLLQIAGTGIALIMITVLGIKYILASVEEKAEIKKMAVPIVIGSFLLFGAVALMEVMEKFSTSVINK